MKTDIFLEFSYILVRLICGFFFYKYSEYRKVSSHEREYSNKQINASLGFGRFKWVEVKWSLISKGFFPRFIEWKIKRG